MITWEIRHEIETVCKSVNHFTVDFQSMLEKGNRHNRDENAPSDFRVYFGDDLARKFDSQSIHNRHC